MDETRFAELKDRATNILFALDRLPHSGAIIHDRSRLYHTIVYRVKRLQEMGEEEKGESILVGSHHATDFTLNGLKKYLDEATCFVNKHRKKGVKHAKTN